MVSQGLKGRREVLKWAIGDNMTVRLAVKLKNLAV